MLTHNSWSESNRAILTEFTNFEAIVWTVFKETTASSAPAIIKTGISWTAATKDAASFGESTVSNDSLPISWSASTQPSTHKGAWI